jgi:catechol 2,3-dioxygenase-like lactoylglutathione lyase family enzyme
MISHVHVGIGDFDRAFAFYAALLEPLGLELKFKEPENGWAGWMSPGVPRPLFLIGLPYDRQSASPGNGQMIALQAPSRAVVDRCHAVALARGGRSEGAPGLRPHYHPNYYGAYFRDPDGNKLCVCCHQPEPGP